MNKLLNARKTLRKNSKKGFTLVELIVVIVIIAILVAALTPAILGAIKRANEAADQADCRTMMMAASVAGMADTSTTPTVANILDQFTGGSNVYKGTYYVYFDGPLSIGCTLTNGRSGSVSLGNTSVASVHTVTVT